MADSESITQKRPGRIKDARGRTVSQLDPVKVRLLNLDTAIPAETLHAMVDDILPGAVKKKWVQVASVAFSFLFIVGGHIVYFGYFSTWKGLDLVNTSIYAVQIAVLLSGPVIVFRMARTEYAGRVTAVMLTHVHCPHCGYDLRGLPIDPDDGATVCPECGCAWRLVGATDPSEP